LTDLYIFI